MRQQHIDAIRSFNRFYTHRIGVLTDAFLNSAFSLTEARVLYEIAHHDRITASDLTRDLEIDPGYLSRILAKFSRKGLVRRSPSEEDARRAELSLTPRGIREFSVLDKRQQESVREMLKQIPAGDGTALVSNLRSAQRILKGPGQDRKSVSVRTELRAGDIGWIIHRQAVLYHDEYGWDYTYEALVAEILARFVKDFDRSAERCWIAERESEILGSVFCVRKSDKVAQLRLLYVEPSERGAGLGTRLVNECIAFARHCGYRKLMLWTNSVLHSARRIYERAGFKPVAEEHHRSFGQKLIGQTWEIDL